MKTTIELPDPLFRRAKSKAAESGMTMKQFFTEAIQDKLARKSPDSTTGHPAWMQGFGKLRRVAHTLADRVELNPKTRELTLRYRT